MAIQVDDYGRPMDGSPSNGVPRNFSTTNNGSNWQGPDYTTTWNLQPVDTSNGAGVSTAGRLQYDPTTGQYRWLGPINENTNTDATGRGDGSAPSGGLPTWARALPAIPAVARQLAGGNNTAMSPELQQLLALALKRMSGQQGLFDAINQQALAGLPNRQG